MPELRPDDRAILDALANGPRSAQEIADKIRRDAREDWLHENGIYDEEVEDPPGIVKLMAHTEARKRGLKLLAHEIDPRLRSLEMRGAVERIQVEGQRPMLWSRRV